MAIYKPGRLYRKLPTIPKPLFNFNTPALGNKGDSTISSIVIHRGNSDSQGGVPTTTCEVEFPSYMQGVSGQDMTVDIATPAAVALTALTGQGAITDRFTGRLGRQEVQDFGQKRTTKLTGASWSAQLSTSPQKFSFASGVSVMEVLRTSMKPTHLPKMNVVPLGSFDTTYETITNETFSDLIGRYAEDIGILCVNTRSGQTQIRNLPYRAWKVGDTIANALPLSRSQCLAPADWAQPNEGVARALSVKRRRGTDNVLVTENIGLFDGTEPVDEYDWTYFRGHTDQWLYAHALRAQGFQDRYRMDKLSIDLLQLLSSPRTYDRQQAGRLLNMEAGDPIFLSGDWPTVFRGVYFANGITETIGPDTWQLDLEITSYRETVGQVSPVVPVKVWDHASYPWQDETREWNQV